MAGLAVKKHLVDGDSPSTNEVLRLDRLSAEVTGSELLLKDGPGRRASSQPAGDMPLPAAQAATRPQAAWKSDEATDQLIRAAYLDGARGAVSELAAKLGIEPWRISKRAGELKIAAVRLKDVVWSSQELAIVEDLAELGEAAVLRELRQRGFERSPAAVSNMVEEFLWRQERSDAWSARALADLMGVDPHVVLRWIERGGLKARQVGGQWEITRKALKAWIVDHPQAVNIKKVNQIWFIDMLGGEGA
ncbi:MAG: DNA-binding protein [Nevskiaceae bacterium]|nr:MAG: DNA-binding protein [Nevskiaceae bacterium]